MPLDITIKAEKGDNDKEFKLYMGQNESVICRYRGNFEFSYVLDDKWGYDYKVSENLEVLIGYSGKTITAKYRKIENLDK